MLEVDKANQRIAVGVKQLSIDPWANIDTLYKVGDLVTGSVTKLASFGALRPLTSSSWDGSAMISSARSTGPRPCSCSHRSRTLVSPPSRPRPVVARCSPVVPAVRWRPYGVRSVILGDQTAPCRDTRARICPVPGHPCLTSVTADEVLTACLSLMEQAPLLVGGDDPELAKEVA